MPRGVRRTTTNSLCLHALRSFSPQSVGRTDHFIPIGSHWTRGGVRRLPKYSQPTFPRVSHRSPVPDLSSCVGASDEIEVFFEGPLAASLRYLDRVVCFWMPSYL